MDDDTSGFGGSYGVHKTVVVAGNSFDYLAIYEEAILKAGYLFVPRGLTPYSSFRRKDGRDSIVNQTDAVSGGIPILRMSDYKYVDLILGKQCQSKMEREGVEPLKFKTFGEEMQDAIPDYCQAGGSFFVPGAYTTPDLWDSRLAKVNEKDERFTMEVLKYR